MTDIDQASRRILPGIAVAWGFAVVFGTVVALVVAEPKARFEWLLAGLGLCLLISFAVQLCQGRVRGFIERMSVSMFGCLIILSVIGLGFALASIAPIA